MTRDELYAAYSKEMGALHEEYYPRSELFTPLIGDRRQEYLDKWGEINERYKKLGTWSK